MPLLQRRCQTCGLEYELLESRGELFYFPRTDMTDDEARVGDDRCPACGVEGPVRLLGWSHGIGLGGSAGAGKIYPYFDRALVNPVTGLPGIEVQSAQHRAALCKAQGVVPLDTRDFRWEEQIDDDRNRKEELARKRREIEREMYEGPNRADYLKARDRINELGPEYWGVEVPCR